MPCVIEKIGSTQPSISRILIVVDRKPHGRDPSRLGHCHVPRRVLIGQLGEPSVGRLSPFPAKPEELNL